jgi:endonuclease/exonuclease/phosphatase family metal-dependent hydrolase
MRTILILSLLTALFTEAQSQSLKVMTYNIRLNTTSDGVNSWPNRKETVADLIKKINSDAFGVQEALHDQMQDLLKALPDYAFVGVGRDDGKEKGEYTAIFYKKARLKVLKSESFWLSETPDVPGSKGWDAAITRMATHAIFKDIKTKREFIFVTTHFDHIGVEARKRSAETLALTLSGMGAMAIKPTIFCGDLNIKPDDEAYALIKQKSNGILKDARPSDNTQGTFCGFEKGKMGCIIIDYIFHTSDITIEKFEVIQENDGQYYPSDHLPVVATLKLAPKR